MDNAKKIELTAEGRQKLIDELAYREGEKHDEIVERIKEARGFGDLSENSEYDAAKEEEARNASRINEIRQILSIATVVEAGTGHDLAVSIGTTVELQDEKGVKNAVKAFVLNYGRKKAYGYIPGSHFWNAAILSATPKMIRACEDAANTILHEKGLI